MSEHLPLFPLGMVLFPGQRVPLHIFEERYRLMIGECLESETEFGLMFGTDDDFKGIGCAARVTDVINQFADGRLNIIVEGTDRIRLIERSDDQPYISGMVERVPDEGDTPPPPIVERTRNLYVEALRLSIGWYRAPEHESEDIAALSYRIAAALGIPPERQQILLEQTSIGNRYRLLKDTLEDALEGLREHARKVSGNGKAH